MFHTTAVKSSVSSEEAGGDKLHPARIRTTGRKIINKNLLFIPYYCTGMQDALIF
jgi:hypothetical protein